MSEEADEKRPRTVRVYLAEDDVRTARWNDELQAYALDPAR